MPKRSMLIRLNPDVYQELDHFRLKHESFSNAVWRLLRLNEQMRGMLQALGGESPQDQKRR